MSCISLKHFILFSDLTKEKKDKAAVVKQSENLSEEYDRVCKLNNKLEKEVASGDFSKKDD
jgi:Bap31/Bap29 cytoplasmic coiled-coil domain